MPRPCEHCREMVNQPPALPGEPVGTTDAHGIAWELLPPGVHNHWYCPVCNQPFSHGTRIALVRGAWTHLLCVPIQFWADYAGYQRAYLHAIQEPQAGRAPAPPEVLEAMAKKKRRKVDVLFPAGEIPRRRGVEPHG